VEGYTCFVCGAEGKFNLRINMSPDQTPYMLMRELSDDKILCDQHGHQAMKLDEVVELLSKTVRIIGLREEEYLEEQARLQAAREEEERAEVAIRRAANREIEDLRFIGGAPSKWDHSKVNKAREATRARNEAARLKAAGEPARQSAAG